MIRLIIILLITLGIQLFADEYIDNFVRYGGGLKMPEDWKEKAEFIDVKVRGELPKHFDIREEIPNGFNIPIKRQLCGDCWAHSVISTIELAWYWHLQTDNFFRFAQQELISTCPNTGGGCNGGYFGAFDYALGITGAGLPMDEDLPYQGKTTKCNTEVEKKPRGVKWAYVGSRKKNPSIEQLKQAMLDYKSPLSVTVKAFSHNGDSVYTECASGFIDHMVVIIGWQDDSSYFGGGYWYMLNSWGKSFGDNGIAKVQFLNKYGGKCARLGETAAIVTQLE